MKGTAYWVNPYGKILNIGYGIHMQDIVKGPEKFGLTQKYVDSVYKKYGEHLGQEGKARDELIDNVTKKGFIHIRLFVNKHWTVTIQGFTPKVKKSLSKWAEEARKDKSAGKHMPVILIDLKTNKVYRDWTINDLYYDKHMNEDIYLDDVFHKVEVVDELPVYKPSLRSLFE